MCFVDGFARCQMHVYYRDDARNVMAAMVAELGPTYLGFALDVLESALPDRGYMGHIRGYTLHFLLEGLSKVIIPGSLIAAKPRLWVVKLLCSPFL